MAQRKQNYSSNNAVYTKADYVRRNTHSKADMARMYNSGQMKTQADLQKEYELQKKWEALIEQRQEEEKRIFQQNAQIMQQDMERLRPFTYEPIRTTGPRTANSLKDYLSGQTAVDAQRKVNAAKKPVDLKSLPKSNLPSIANSPEKAAELIKKQEVQKYLDMIKSENEGTGYEGLRRQRQKTGGNGTDFFLTIDEYKQLRKSNQEKAKTGILDYGMDPRYMTDKGLKEWTEKTQAKAEETYNAALKIQQDYAKSQPGSAWAKVMDFLEEKEGLKANRPADYDTYQNEYDADLYDSVHGKGAWERRWENDIQTDEDVDRLDEEMAAMWDKLTPEQISQYDNGEALLNRSTAETRRKNSIARADDFFSHDYDPRVWAMDATQEEQREALYDRMMGEEGGYAQRISTMNKEDRDELNRRLDAVLTAAEASYGDTWDEHARDYGNQLKVGDAYTELSQQGVKEQEHREVVETFGQQAEELKTQGYTPEYDESLIPEQGKWVEDEEDPEGMLHYEGPTWTEIEKAYYIINNPHQIGGTENFFANTSKYMFLDDSPENNQVEQFNIFFKYDKANGTHKAEAFLEGLDNYLQTCLTEYQDMWAQSAAEDWRGVPLRVLSYPGKLLTGAAGTIGTIKAAFGDENARDVNSDYYAWDRAINTLRGTQNKNIDTALGGSGTAEFFLNVADSIADNLMAVGVGKTLAPDNLNRAMRFTQLIMSGSATSSRMSELLKKGMDPTEAALYAIGDGAIEWITEKYSLEQLMRPDIKDMLGDWKKITKFIAKNTAAEGSEEIASDLLNIALDSVLSSFYGNQTEIMQRFNELVTGGMDPTEASRTALTEKIHEIGMSGLAGAISGGFMSGGRVALNSIGQKQIGQNVYKNRNLQKLLDVGLGMKEGTQSRQMAQELLDRKHAGQKPSNTQLGKLAQLMAMETNEEQASVIRETMTNTIRQELQDQGVKNPDQYAEVISRNLFEGNERLSKEDRSTLAQSSEAIDLWAKYNTISDQTMNLYKQVGENTAAQRSVMNTISDLTSGRARSSSVLAAEIERSIRETNSAAEAIDNLQERSPNLLSERYSQKAKELLESDPDAKKNTNYLDDVMKIRLAAMSLAKETPETRLSKETAQALFEEARAEFDEIDKTRIKNQAKVVPGQGIFTLNGAEYGTDDFTEKTKGYSRKLRNQLGALGEVVVRMGNNVKVVDNPDMVGVYGFETGTGAIVVNVHNHKSLSHSMLATLAHEMTHWLEQNSWEGYNQLRQYAVDQLRAKGENVEQLLVDKILNIDAARAKAEEAGNKAEADALAPMDMNGAMADLVAQSCENLLASKNFRDEIAKTNPSLYNKIRNYVKNFVARLSAAVRELTGNQLHYEARQLMDQTEQIAKLWLGARQEALGREVTGELEAEEDVNFSVEEGIKNEYGEGGFEEDKYFKRIILNREKYTGNSFIKVGRIVEGGALNQVGIPVNDVRYDESKIRYNLQKHEDWLTPEILADVPKMLQSPIIITEYKGAPNTITVYSNRFIKKQPLMVGVVVSKDRKGLLVQPKIRTVNIRSDYNSIINDDSVLYITTNKKEALNWFQVLGINAPIGGKQFGLIRKIQLTDKKVNTGTGVNFSVEQLDSMSTNELNQAYMQAIRDGDTARQQELVDEAARRNGYTMKVFHGTPTGGFTQFRDWSYFTENKNYADRYNHPSASSSRGYAVTSTQPMTYELYMNPGRVFDTRDTEAAKLYNKARMEYGMGELLENGLPDWTDGRDIIDYIEENDLPYDTIILDEGADGGYGDPVVKRGLSYVSRANMVKDAAPVTYDDAGNVIPLSERFNMEKPDIRWSVEEGNKKGSLTAAADLQGPASTSYTTGESTSMNILSQEEDPVKREREEELDKEYLQAIQDGDVKKQLQMIREKINNTEGIYPFFAAHNKHVGEAARIARAIKNGDMEAISKAATEMAEFVPDDAVLIPMPGHEGIVTDSTDTMLLAKAISEITGAPVYNVLEGAQRGSRHQAKLNRKTGVTAEQMGMHQVGDLPAGSIPIIIDNVVAVGETAKAAIQAIKGSTVLSYTKGSTENVVKGLKAAYATKDEKGEWIPLSKKGDINNPNWRFSVEQSPDMEVDRFMLGLNEFNMPTAQERTMLRQYKDLHGTIDVLRMKIRDREGMQRQLLKKQTEQGGKLSAYDREQMRKINVWLSNDRTRLDKVQAELVKVTSDKGYAKLMMKQDSLMKNLVRGVTADQLISLVEDMSRQLDEVNKAMQERAGKLEQLAQKNAVLKIRTQFNQNGLKRIAAKLKADMNSDLETKEIENRLALIALKMKEGKYDANTAEELTDLILGKMRGSYDSYVLSTLRGREIGLSPAQLKELKAKDSGIRELNTELAGTGIRFVANAGTNLEHQWGEISNEITSLDPDTAPLEQVDELMRVIRSERNTIYAERFNKESVMQTSEAVLKAAAELVPEIVTDEKSLKLIRETLQFVQEISRQAAETAGEISDMTAVVDRLKKTGAAARSGANKLTGDINEAISYFNALSEQSEAAMWKRERILLIDQLKNEKTQELLAEQEKWKQKIEKDKNARQKMESNLQLRKKITTNVSRIRKLLINETDIRNVPEHMKSLARQMLGKIVENDIGGGRKISGIEKQDLLETKRVLDVMNSQDGEFTLDNLRLINDEEAQSMVAEALADLEDGIGFYNNRLGGDLLANLQGLHNALSRISDAVSTITSVISAERIVSFLDRRIDLADAAEDVRKDMANSRFKGNLIGRGSKAVKAVSSAVFYGNMTPVYFFKMLRNGGMNAVWQDMQKGENRSGLETQKARARLAELAEKTGYRNWNEEKHDVLLGGLKRKISIENMMELYAIWKREQTTNPEMSQHLTKGGIFIQEEEENTGRLRRENTQQRAIRVTDEEIQAMYGQMTDAQKEYLDGIVSYLSNEMSELGNEASMRMYGIKKYKESYYFPMKVWDGVKSARSDKGITGTDENRAAHRSWSKRRQHMAQNALVIGSFTKDAVNHIVEMINYNTMAPSIENVNKILNFQFTEGETKDDFTKRNLRIMFKEAYGKEALRYLETFMKDLNGGVTQDQRKTLRDRALTMFKKNAVAGSLSVALQQPLSYIRAAMMISPKYLTMGLSPAYWKGSYEEMLKHSGVAVIKDMGRFDMNFGQSAKDFITPETGNNAYETVSDFLTKAPELMDRMTWTRMWSAVKAEQKALHPDMDVSSDAFLDMVGERFNELMRTTQVYDSIMVKSSNMRSQNFGMKLITSFMAEPTLSLNVLADAVGKVRAGDKGSIGHMAKAGATFLLSAILQAVVKGLMGSGRTPDDKKTWLENFLNKFQYNLQNEANPISLIPGYSDLIEVLKTGELKDDAMGALGKLFSIVQTGQKAMQGNGKGVWRDLEDTVGQFTQLFTNIPAKNLSRDVRAIRNWILGDTYAKRATSGNVIRYQAEANMFTADNLLGTLNAWLGEAGFITSNKAYYSRMYEAQKRGDKNTAEGIREYLTLGKGVKAETIQSGIRSMAKKDDDLTAEKRIRLVTENSTDKGGSDYIIQQLKDGEITDTQARKMIKEIYPDKSEDDIFWQVDRAKYQAETGKEKVSGNYYRLVDAVNNNKAAEIQKAVNDLLAHGITKEKIKSKLSDWKSDYLAADSRQRIRIRDALEKAYKAAGYTAADADKVINGWIDENKKKNK